MYVELAEVFLEWVSSNISSRDKPKQACFSLVSSAHVQMHIENRETPAQRGTGRLWRHQT